MPHSSSRSSDGSPGRCMYRWRRVGLVSSYVRGSNALTLHRNCDRATALIELRLRLHEGERKNIKALE